LQALVDSKPLLFGLSLRPQPSALFSLKSQCVLPVSVCKHSGRLRKPALEIVDHRLGIMFAARYARYLSVEREPLRFDAHRTRVIAHVMKGIDPRCVHFAVQINGEDVPIPVTADDFWRFNGQWIVVDIRANDRLVQPAYLLSRNFLCAILLDKRLNLTNGTRALAGILADRSYR
jgi:hypothetical protein